MIDCKKRYQKGLSLIDLYPSLEGYCACGCGQKLNGNKKRWASRECNDRVYYDFAIFKGNISAIRNELFIIDQGYCRNCGVFDPNWQADHITPVSYGGGACSLENFQTLCYHCHLEKTIIQRAAQCIAYSSQAAIKEVSVLL